MEIGLKMDHLSVEYFGKCIHDIVSISDAILDGWVMKIKDDSENGKYIVKKQTTLLKAPEDASEVPVTFEYHVAYNISYGVPVLCFNIWQPDGSLLTLEGYWKSNTAFGDSNMYETLTQMDHPVLCKHFLSLHPCKTQEILQTFLATSKNPVISWLTVVGPFVSLNLLEEYVKHC
ncbi:unnamed protein product [Phaedon cochleariae]|uniref:Ubiquitin-like-conjugating enzyme ATG10 n=2 Tax=Phaedon cochleariae TaxID=80249 RepID=A0A9P0DQR1_PHACE|nr:unnamed protein product [Phaedon cochleariae]